MNNKFENCRWKKEIFDAWDNYKFSSERDRLIVSNVIKALEFMPEFKPYRISSKSDKNSFSYAKFRFRDPVTGIKLLFIIDSNPFLTSILLPANGAVLLKQKYIGT